MSIFVFLAILSYEGGSSLGIRIVLLLPIFCKRLPGLPLAGLPNPVLSNIFKSVTCDSILSVPGRPILK